MRPAKLFLRKDGVSFQLDTADTVQVALQDGDVVHTAPAAAGVQAPPAQKAPVVVVPPPAKAAKAAAPDDDSDDSDSDEPAQPPAGGAAAGKQKGPAKRMTKDAIAWLRAKFGSNANALAAPSKMQAESLADQCVTAFPALKGVVTAHKVIEQAAAFRKAHGLSAAPAAVPVAAHLVAKPAVAKAVTKPMEVEDDSSDEDSSDSEDAPAPPKPAAKSPVAPPTKPTPAAAGKEMPEDDERPSQKTGSQKRKVTFQPEEEDSSDDDDDDDDDSDSDEDDARPPPKKPVSRAGSGNGAALPYKPPGKIAK